jgi:hypothetical protein
MPFLMDSEIEKAVGERVIEGLVKRRPMGSGGQRATGLRRHRLERWAAWASFGSAAVHAALIHEHAEEWWGYGLFFGLSALAQVVLGLALLTDAVNPRDTGPRWASIRRGVYWLGLLGTLALLVLYAITRTAGIPWFGPAAGEVEAVSAIDLVAKAFELVAAGALVLLLRMPKTDDPAEGGPMPAS